MKKLQRPSMHFTNLQESDGITGGITTLTVNALSDEPYDQESREEKKKNVVARFIEGLESDNMVTFNKILAQVPDLVDVYLEKPLPHMAAEYGGLKILQELVSKGTSSVNAVSEDGDATTPLFWAIKEGHAEVVDWLLSNGARHGPLNACHDNAVYVAVTYNQIKLLDVLQAHKCDGNFKNSNGDFPLKLVIREHNLKALDRLIDMGIVEYDNIQQGVDGHTILSAALMCISKEALPDTFPVLECLFDKPAFNLLAQQPMIYQLLTEAVMKDNVDMMIFLLRYLDPLDSERSIVRLQEESVERKAAKCLKSLILSNGTSPSILEKLGRNSAIIMRTILENTDNVPMEKDIAHQCMPLDLRFYNVVHYHNESLEKLQMLVDYGYNVNSSYSAFMGTPVKHAAIAQKPCAVLWFLRTGCTITSPLGRRMPLTQALHGLSGCDIPVNLVKVAILLIEYMTTYNDLSRRDLAKAKQVHDHQLDHLLEPSGIDFNALLDNRLTIPRQLQHHCRIFILRSLGINSFKAVHKLGLPTRMVEYVMLHDLEELVLYVGNTYTMQKVPRRPACHVHFGDPEDILSTSFFISDLSKVSEWAKKKKQDIYTRCVTALRKDDFTMVNEILTEIPDIVDVYLERPLTHMAAEYGGLKILQELVSKTPSSVNAVSEDGDATTALFWAIKEGHIEVVDWLLSNGAHHGPLNACHDNAVYIAVYYNQIELLDVLQAHKCSCNTPNRYGDLPFKHVIRVSNVVALKKLTEMEVDIYGWNSQEKFRHTLLSDALMYQVTPCISTVLQCLLERPSFNASFHQPMIHQLLMVVIWKDDAAALVLLLKYLNPLGEELEVILTRLQKECLKWPALNCLRELIKYYGICPSVLTTVGKHPPDVFRTFLENDARVILQNDIMLQCIISRSSGLLYYKGSNHERMIDNFQLLVDHGYRMNMSSPDPLGSPVFHVTKRAIPCALLWLLRAGCDVFSPFDGKTPLALALEPFVTHLTINATKLKVAILLIEYLPTHNDPTIELYINLCKNTREPLNLRTDFCVPNYSDEGLCGLLLERSTNPRPLQHLSRIAILRALGTNSFKGVHKLGLPTRMVKYVMLHDLEDLVRIVHRNPPPERSYTNCVHSCFK